MFPIRLERDTPIVDWQATELWATSTSNPVASTHLVRSDGGLKGDFGSIDLRNVTIAITARLSVCAGIHLPGPKRGDDFTLYAVSVVAMAGDSNVRPYLFMGESPASITNAAGGDIVTDIKFLAFGDTSGTDGSMMKHEVTVAVFETPNDRAVCFGIGMMAGVATGLAAMGLARLCVRRLIGPGPRVIDPNKL